MLCVFPACIGLEAGKDAQTRFTHRWYVRVGDRMRTSASLPGVTENRKVADGSGGVIHPGVVKCCGVIIFTRFARSPYRQSRALSCLFTQQLGGKSGSKILQ